MPINCLEFTIPELRAMLTGGFVEVLIGGTTVRFRADRPRPKRSAKALKAAPAHRGFNYVTVTPKGKDFEAKCSKCTWGRLYHSNGAANGAANFHNAKHRRTT